MRSKNRLASYLRTRQTRNGLLYGMEKTANIFKNRHEQILLTERSFRLFDLCK